MRFRVAALVPSVLLAGVLASTPACRRDEAPARPDGTAPEPSAASSAAASPAARALPPMPRPATGTPITDLAQRLAALGGTGELRLAPGVYDLEPTRGEDAACAPCNDAEWLTRRPGISIGLHVVGRGIRIVGASARDTILRTRAGYGVYFDSCEDCSIEGVTITDGIRDGDDGASDAAIVVRNGAVRVSDCVLADNLGSEFVIQQSFVGVSGIVVREGGSATVERCRIVRTSWDGIALLRGGRADVRDVVIDGVDRGAGMTATGGRGVGLRLTPGAVLTATDVLVARQGGGLGAYGNAEATLQDCVIEESSLWGVLAQPDPSGPPVLRLQGLLVHSTAACGIVVREPVAPASALADVRLVLTALGGRGTGPCAAAALDVPAALSVTDATAWLTGGPSAGLPTDLSAADFRASASPLMARLAAAPATSESAFVGTGGSVR